MITAVSGQTSKVPKVQEAWPGSIVVLLFFDQGQCEYDAFSFNRNSCPTSLFAELF
jgi:hypothetical protein